MREMSSKLQRRQFLVKGVMVLAAPAVLAGCGAGAPGGLSPQPAVNLKGGAAMLLPLTGPRAALGRNLRLAAELGARALPVYDTGASPESAARAAQTAVAEGATVLAGPLSATATRAVLGAVPREVPVLSLSNTDALSISGAFVLGLTPLHSTDAVLPFAADLGIQSVVMLAPNGPLSIEFSNAMDRVASRLDLRVGKSFLSGSIGSDLGSDLRSALNGRLPDAVFLPTGGKSLLPLVERVDKTGSVLLGSSQWNSLAQYTEESLQGAYYTAPDPAAFRPFSLKFADRNKDVPGIIAAVAHDAAKLAAEVAKARKADPRRALTSAKGHRGALGTYKLAANGLAHRALAVMQISNGSPFVVSDPA